MDNQQGPTVQHWELYSMLCGSLDGRGVWGRMDTSTYMGESPGCSHNIVNRLCSNIKLKVKKKIEESPNSS